MGHGNGVIDADACWRT